MMLQLMRPKAVAVNGWHARLCSLAAYVAIAKKPATVKGYEVPKDVGDVPMPA